MAQHQRTQLSGQSAFLMAAMAAYLGVVAYYLRENALATRALKASRSPPLGVSTVGRSEGKSTDASTLFYPAPFYPAPAKRQMLVNADNMLFDSDRLPFAIVTDLDHASRDPTDFLWKSHFKRAALVRHHALNVDSSERKNRSFFKSSLPYHIEWGTEKVLQSRTAMRNRSMEFSELVRYDHLLLAVCDVTGLVFKIRAEEGKIFQRWALADGDGEESKPFKGEWATVKDGMLWLGSTGKEWTRLDGTVKHRNSEWVKTIDRSGRIENYDWGPVYRSLRKATNTSFPGYLWHESVHFDPANRRWMFLPRKSSASGPYLPVEDETRGTNLLITTAEDFSDIRVQRLGELEPEYGFSSVRKVPGTQSLFVALKVREVGGETGSKICIFDDEDVVTSFGCSDDFSPLKFEGLSFL